MIRKKVESNMSKKKKTAVLIEVFLFSVAVVWVIPVISTMQVSLKNGGFQNYKDVFSTRINDVLILPKMILNSFIITGGTIMIVMISASLAAYAFSKLRFKGRKFFFVLLLSCYAIPILSTLIPNTLLIRNLGLRGSYISMIVLLATANIPLAILIFKGNFDGISSTYLEAAAIDGCTDFQVFLRILLPMSKSAIVNVLVVLFIQVWNDFQIPLVFSTDPEKYTLTLAPTFFGLTQNRLDLPHLFASIVIIAIPVIVFYMFMQDKIVEGMSMGGLKE
ncbi:carbohydrate ABC transporter permease [Eubacterium sp. am_0171]|nr:ABC transporter permease subunit [Eubacterium sp. BIOML-A1]MSD06099.1 ABC transporter permease subunit [Eubacterium sp. BIOML-A2]RYT22233.1 carbohydrate ABC transporter permease [Eubacterium sp. am_0171]